MDTREQQDKRQEAARDFDAVLRERVATGKLSPRVASCLESERPGEDEAGEDAA
jgi:hypothetical protein